MIRYAIVLAVFLAVAAFVSWAFVPARYLPGNRVSYLRLRLRLRLHPGKGFAGIVSLWLRWGRLAAVRRSGRIRPSLPLWERVVAPGEHSVFLGRAQWRHRLRVPLEEHVLVMAPPRTFKTAFLADVVLRYPGPVISTTKADVHVLTSAVRSQYGPVHVFNPQGIGGVASTFRWSPVDGCEDPATAIRRADATRSRCRSRAWRTARSGRRRPPITCDYLRGYFHAAALAGYDMRAVAAWVSGAGPRVPEQMLQVYGGAARGARARRSYDRVMNA
jgi:hypothetical protein